jgi:hypothetical protein
MSETVNVKRFSFPILSLRDSDLVISVLAEWVILRLEELVFSERLSFSFREGSVCYEVSKREYYASIEYVVEVDGRKELWIKMEKGKERVSNFILGEGGIGLLPFDEVVSRIEAMLNKISEAVIAADEEMGRVREVLAGDSRFKDAFSRVFEKRLGVMNEEGRS